jgi:TolB-like protein/Tfp pilus assembly protein PilF
MQTEPMLDSRRVAMGFIAELTRRRVFRTLVAYGIAAFAVLQIIEPIMHGLHWPDAVLSYVVVALALGFPIVVALAWAFDINAGRIERTPTESPRSGLRGVGLALALLGIGVVAAVPVVYFFMLRKNAPAPAEGTSIAVLPFANLSSDKDNEYFSDGITEDLISNLANIEGLRVASRTAVFALKGKAAGVQEIGTQLNVKTLLEGSIRREGTALRVTAQLIDVKDGFHLWSKTYDRELNSIFAVEEEIAGSIAEALRRKLVGLKPATVSVEAHDLYLKGLFFANKRSAEGLRKAQGFYEQAIARDPRYALAFTGLADVLTLRAEYDVVPAAEILSKAKRAARQALELDPGLAEAHASLGLIAIHELDWSTAMNEHRTAIEMKPDYAMARMWYALVLAATGKFPQAREELEVARRLDPTSAIINTNLAYACEGTHDYQCATEQFRKTLEMNPDFEPARSGLAYAYAMRGQSAEALAEVDKLERGSNGDLWSSTRALILAISGRREEASALLSALEKRSGPAAVPFGVRAQIWAALGDKQRALALLEEACAAHEMDLMLLKVHPVFDGLRSEPRFKSVLRCAHFE